MSEEIGFRGAEAVNDDSQREKHLAEVGIGPHEQPCAQQNYRSRPVSAVFRATPEACDGDVGFHGCSRGHQAGTARR